MGSEHEETIRRLVAAFSARDTERFVAGLDADVELHPLRAQLEGKPYRGHDGARKMLADLDEDWEYNRIQLEELLDAPDDQMVALCRLQSRGRASRVDLDVPMAFYFRLRNGKVIYSKSFSEQADALSAAGIE